MLKYRHVMFSLTVVSMVSASFILIGAFAADSEVVVDTSVANALSPKANNTQPTTGSIKLPVVDHSPIKGFHPIKRALRPIENIGAQSVILGHQITRLERPLAALQPTMLSLKKEMGRVQTRMGSMQGNLKEMEGSLQGVSSDMQFVGKEMGSVRGDLTGVRGEIGGMRKQIAALEVPIRQLQQPIERLEGPLNKITEPVIGVQRQLTGVQEELNDLKLLLGTVLASIYIAAGLLAFGMPVAAFIVYKNRHQLFPHTRERDFPGSKTMVVADAAAVASLTEPEEAAT